MKKTFTIVLLSIFFLSCKEKFPAPTASFTVIVSKGEATFSNQSTNADTYQWDFGDNIGTSNQKEPKYIYKTPGKFNVTLKVIGLGGETQIQKSIDVNALKPTLAFSFTYLNNGEVQFSNESKDADSYIWFVDGQTKTTSKDPKIAFTYNGKYKIKLKAIGFGDSDELEKEIIVTNGKDPAPIIAFDYLDLGLGKYRFINKTRNAESFQWDFGDKSSKSSLENPEHIFEENGNYTLKFTATGKGGTAYKDSVIKVTSSYDYYTYTVENKSAYPITIYNNETNNILQNFSDISVPSNSKVFVKVRSKDGLKPMLKSSDTNLQLEYSTTDNKLYTLSAYYFVYEVKFTGTCEPITINSNIKGQKETLSNVTLPSSINTKLSNLEILEVQASKNNVNGILNIQIYIKNLLVQTKSITDPFASITIKYNVSKKQFEVYDYSPEEWYCGKYNGNRLITGPKGGCYYINSNGNKTYVDRSFCNCN